MQIFTIIKKPEDEAAETPMEKEPKRPIRAFPISTVKPIIRPNHEVTLIESSSRPSLTEPILEIPTISSRLRPEPITDVKIHPKLNTCSVYRANDRRNIQVHNPFKFKDFGVTELDELGPIIRKKKNKIVGELMTSLGKTYEHLKKIPEELGIQSAIPTPKQAQSQSSGRKESIWNWSLKSEFLDWNMHFDMLDALMASKEYWRNFVVAPDGTMQELMMLKQRRDTQINQDRMRKIEENYRHGSNNGLKLQLIFAVSFHVIIQVFDDLTHDQL
ncbi:hypothetical protein Tco_0499394 [Tanacetum coccineum]